MSRADAPGPNATTARRIAEVLVRRRRSALVAALVGTMAFAAGLPRLTFDFSPDRMYPRHDPDRVAFERYRDAFPRHDGKAVVLVEGEGDLLAPSALERLRALTDALGALPLVEQAESLTTAQTLRVHDGVIEIGPVVDEASDRLLLARARLARDPLLADRLVGPDGAWLAVEVDLVADHNTDLGRVAFRDALAEVIDRHRSDFETLTLTGVPVLQAGYMDLSGRDQGTLLPLMVLLAIGLLFAVLRDWLDAVLPVGIMLLATVWMMGAMAWAGAPMSFLSAAMPVILLVIGVSDVLHVMAAHERARRPGVGGEPDATSAAEDALTYTLAACAMTSLTTAIGFASIAATGIPLLVDFGLYTAFGVLVTYGLTMALLPNVLLRRRRAAPRGPRMGRPRLLAFFARVAAWVERTPGRVALGATLASLAVSLGAVRLSTETLMFDDLMPGTALRQSIDRVDERYGVLALGVWVETDAPDGIATPRGLAALAAVERELGAIPEARAVTSLASLLGEVDRAFVPEAEGALPDRLDAIRQEMLVLSLLGPHLLDPFVVPDGSSARAVARIADVGSGRMGTILDQLEARIRPLAAEGLRVELAGQTVVAQDVIRAVRENLASSLALAIALIAALCLLVYRSPSLALIALVPNVLTVSALLGLLGLSGFPLKTSMILVFCIAFGIAVDDTIHVIARYSHLRRAGSRDGAASSALRDTGVPMTWTTAVLGAGFLVLVLSRFMGLAQMGVWVTASLAIAWSLDLVLLPALLVLHERRAANTGAQA